MVTAVRKVEPECQVFNPVCPRSSSAAHAPSEASSKEPFNRRMSVEGAGRTEVDFRTSLRYAVVHFLRYYTL
jgi:hypothetical protein